LKIHIVQKGETLWEIAEKYHVNFEELKQLNSHLASPDMIMPGMKIRIPTETKKVKQGKAKTEMKKTMPAKKEMPIQKYEEPVPIEQPKLMPEKPTTLPILEGEKEHYPTTVFPEVQQPKKEKKESKKKEIQKAPEKPHMPAQPALPYPEYEAPMQIEYPCYPPVYMSPCYSPCYYYPMIMPEYKDCGCQGQRAQFPGYPFAVQPPPPMPMYHSYPPAGTQIGTQMYPDQQSNFELERSNLEMYPAPPVPLYEKNTSDNNNANE